MEDALAPDIHAMIESRDFAKLKSAVRDMEIHDLTDLLGALEGDELAMVFRLLPQSQAAEVFGDLDFDKQEELMSALSAEKVADILQNMPPDERTELLEELPGEVAQRLLASLRGKELSVARRLLAYPEDSVGRLMTPEYVGVKPDWTVTRVLEHIREAAPEVETLNVLYVVGDGGKLIDEVPLERIILAGPDQTVRELMDEQVASLQAAEDQEAAVEMFKKYDAVALPVVNNQGVLVGIVTFDDVMDVAEEEGTEDFQKAVGMEPLEAGYFATGFGSMLAKRLPWLALLLVAQTLATTALIGFNAIPLFATLVLFMPLINSPAGNTGSQTAGLMIRGLALQEMATGDWWKVLLRELARGLALGVALAAMGWVVSLLFARSLDLGDYPPEHIASAVAMALVAAVTLANVVGAMLPLFFKRVGLDPAVTSGPFIASLMDVSGILIYFSIGTAVLKLTE
jgi:magnesium transporter